MSMPTKRFNVTAGRPYTKRNGEQKKQWINLGTATQWDDGNISIELHTAPVGNWFDGKLNLFEQTERQEGQRSAPAPSNDFDDVPFG